MRWFITLFGLLPCLAFLPFTLLADENTDLSILQKEYHRLESDVEAMTAFIVKAADDRASFRTLANFSKKITVIEEEIKELEKAASGLKIKDQSLEIDRIWVTNKAKKSQALGNIAKGDTTYIYLSFFMPKSMSSVAISLKLTAKNNGKVIANIEKERPRKDEGIEQRTGIAVPPEILTLGESYIFSATLTTSQGKKINQKKSFTYGGKASGLGSILITAVDGQGRKVNSTIGNDTELRFRATVPQAMEGRGEIIWKLFDSERDFVEGSEKREEIKESGKSSLSKFGFSTDGLLLERYRVLVTHRLKGQKTDQVEAEFPFEVTGSLIVHRLSISNSKKSDVEGGILHAGDQPYLFVHYTAKQAAQMASIRVYDAVTKEKFYEADVTERIKADRKKHRIGIRLNKDTLSPDRNTTFEASFVDDQGNYFSVQRNFRLDTYTFALDLPKRLNSGQSTNITLKPPAEFRPPFTVHTKPYYLLVHQESAGSLKLSVTGVASEGTHQANLKVTITDSEGRIAEAERGLQVYGAPVAKPKPKPKPKPSNVANVAPKGTGNNLFASLWGYKEGDWLKDPIHRQVSSTNSDYINTGLERCHDDYLDHPYKNRIQISSDRDLMTNRNAIRSRITKKFQQCTGGVPYYKTYFTVTIRNGKYDDLGIGYDASCEKIDSPDIANFWYTDDTTQIYKLFTSNNPDSVYSAIIMACLAPTKFIKNYIPEMPSRPDIKPSGCQQSPYGDFACSSPPSKLPNELW
jgi:hypothetical protein